MCRIVRCGKIDHGHTIRARWLQSLRSASTIRSLANSKGSTFLSDLRSCAHHGCCFSTIRWRKSWALTSPRSMPAARAAVFAGNTLPDGAEPLAQAYAGHQFGGFSPQLGDGRALLLGEVIDRQGRRRDIAFKGSGRTPFARGGDGKAAVGPMLREVLVSEAMHALGIPTTRALAGCGDRRAGVPRTRSARRSTDTRGGEPHPRRDL